MKEYIFLVLRTFSKVILKIYLSEQCPLLASCEIEREKFYPVPQALSASALTTTPSNITSKLNFVYMLVL